MSGIDPLPEETPLVSLMAEAEVKTLSAEDLPGLISELYSGLATIDVRLKPVVITQQRLRAALKRLQPARLSPGESLSVDEADEVSEIYLRIDRELAVEEARADRLFRLYNL